MGHQKFRLFLIILLLPLVIAGACDTGSDPPTPDPGPSPSSPPDLQLLTVASGLDRPLGLTHAGDQSGRIFIVEQGGTIRLLKQGVVSATPFLDISDRAAPASGEMGLLGLAFHPNFSENGRFFVNHTSDAGGRHTVIAEYAADPGSDQADPNSEKVLLTIAQPFPNHNGGQLAFGPDGHLYIATGDGGGGDDPLNNGQKLDTLLGKILRIDVDRQDAGLAYAVPADNPFVDRAGAETEIWAYGFRNPWRFSFDVTAGLLYAGDVGQGKREEIDVVEKGKNYGWRIMEGTICTPGVNPNCSPAGLELPIIDYPRSDGTTVIGGFVYRGSAVPGLAGSYFYGDFGSGRIWTLRYDGTTVSDHRLVLETGRNIAAFGEDAERELYVVDYNGDILKVGAR